MIDALIAGKVYGTPAKRTGASGNTFVTGKVRVAMRDGESSFVNVITFSRSCGEALLALQDGDAVALSGELKVGTYQAKDGTTKPSLDLVAGVALTTYHVSRKRKAVRGESHEQEEGAPNGHQTPAAIGASASVVEGFNDDIPF